MTLPLSKTLDPLDFAALAEELQVVDQHFWSASAQHPLRRWEYALAIRAHDQWANTPALCVGGPIYDVGGAGSPFFRMLDQVHVVDPHEADGRDLAATLREGSRLGAAVFCLSVLEHVEDLDQFCYHLTSLVAPGGLLFVTVDACGCPSHAAFAEVGDPPDQHHFHWMRRRLFGQADLRELAERLLDYQCAWLGARDLTYAGMQVYDYTFASLALVKRP